MSLQLTADSVANYGRFISRVQSTGVVWGLKSDDGWAFCPSNESDADVLLFWSDEAYARRHCKEEWSHYLPTSIPLAQFQAKWLPGMARDGLLIGAQFNAHLAGLEVNPAKVAADLASGP